MIIVQWVIVLFYAFVHMFAWNSPIMAASFFFLAAAFLGFLGQIIQMCARCCLKLCVEGDKRKYVKHASTVTSVLSVLLFAPVNYYWISHLVEVGETEDARSWDGLGMNLVLFFSIVGVQISILLSIVIQLKAPVKSEESPESAIDEYMSESIYN
jgi:hypothetical protein